MFMNGINMTPNNQKKSPKNNLSSITEKLYDEIPYPVLAHIHSHPENMATIAKLHGIEAVPVNQSRILELGCASGGNIIPMAYALPDSEFIGIDLSETQIRDGQEFIHQAGLKNIELFAADLMDLKVDLGKFDYIIAHGLFSWVPEPVQDKVLDLINISLNPNGLAFISYNVLPGWSTQEQIRKMLHFAVKDLDNPQKKAQEGLGFLDILAKMSTSQERAETYQPYLTQSIQDIVKYSNPANFNYWFHEYFEEFNQPFYFSEFIDKCQNNGLQYLADAEFRQLQDENSIMNLYSESGILLEDEVEKQQYLDFLKVRKFRQTILCKQGLKVQRENIRSRIRDMYITSSFVPEKEPSEIKNTDGQMFISLDGKERINVNDPVCIITLKKLAIYYPFEIALPELLDRVQKDLTTGGEEISIEEIFQRVSPILLSGYFFSKVINLNTWVPDRARSITAAPEASVIARLQSLHDQKVVNLVHDSVNLDDFSKFLLQFLDGKTPIDVVDEKVFNLWVSGKIKIHKLNGLEKSGTKSARKFIREEILLILDKFLRANLLVN